MAPTARTLLKTAGGSGSGKAVKAARAKRARTAGGSSLRGYTYCNLPPGLRQAGDSHLDVRRRKPAQDRGAANTDEVIAGNTRTAAQGDPGGAENATSREAREVRPLHHRPREIIMPGSTTRST